MESALISALVVLVVATLGAQTFWISRALGRIELELAQLRAEFEGMRDQMHRDLVDLSARVGRLEGERAA